MLRFYKIFPVWLLLAALFGQTAAYTTQFADAGEMMRLHWQTKTIPIALSTSLTKPNPYIKSDSDINGAITRSLNAWERAADIKFQVSWTDKQTVSPAGNSGDGVSLITIAPTPENLLLFSSDAGEVSARTRIFFNRRGFITEADIVLNPYEQFSTDGSIGTFDFEATLTHEIGHLLGLEHSTVTGATMHENQGRNGIYNLPAYSPRTLAEDDLAGIRALYGAKNADENCCGSIVGKLTFANGKPAKDAQIWVEDAESGQVAAGVLTNADGNFRLEGLLDGQYQIYVQGFGSNAQKSFSAESLGAVEISRGRTQNISKKLKNGAKNFDVQYVGFNGQISELAVPVNGGKSYLIYVGGKNLDAHNLTINFNSPFLSVTPKSLTNQNYGADISVVSFEIKVEDGIPPGEYSFFVKNKDGETQFAVGGLTVEEFINPWNSYLLLPNE
ncbi:MAG: matrixin family metalloprotease [Pyrinomonadaceae bacterium]